MARRAHLDVRTQRESVDEQRLGIGSGLVGFARPGTSRDVPTLAVDPVRPLTTSRSFEPARCE
jgi:hypothetical protein